MGQHTRACAHRRCLSAPRGIKATRPRAPKHTRPSRKARSLLSRRLGRWGLGGRRRSGRRLSRSGGGGGRRSRLLLLFAAAAVGRQADKRDRGNRCRDKNSPHGDLLCWLNFRQARMRGLHFTRNEWPLPHLRGLCTPLMTTHRAIPIRVSLVGVLLDARHYNAVTCNFAAWLLRISKSLAGSGV